VACVSSIILGYDIGVMSGALLFMRSDLELNTFQVHFHYYINNGTHSFICQEEVIVAALNFMAIPGETFHVTLFLTTSAPLQELCVLVFWLTRMGVGTLS